VTGYEIEVWAGVLATAGTPAPLLQRLNREINEISASPELKVLLDPDGSVRRVCARSSTLEEDCGGAADQRRLTYHRSGYRFASAT
jgi:hypothetical protein